MANSVLPQPGSPVNNTPCGILAPLDKTLCGFYNKINNNVNIYTFKYCTKNSNSCLTSSIPSISENLVFDISGLFVSVEITILS